jgi:hypothetical protein
MRPTVWHIEHNKKYTSRFLPKLRELRATLLSIANDDLLMTEIIYDKDVDPVVKGLILSLTMNVPDEVEALDTKINSLKQILLEWEEE